MPVENGPQYACSLFNEQPMYLWKNQYHVAHVCKFLKMGIMNISKDLDFKDMIFVVMYLDPVADAFVRNNNYSRNTIRVMSCVIGMKFVYRKLSDVKKTHEQYDKDVFPTNRLKSAENYRIISWAVSSLVHVNDQLHAAIEATVHWNCFVIAWGLPYDGD